MEANENKIISLGKKPKRGGSPPMLSRIRIVAAYRVLGVLKNLGEEFGDKMNIDWRVRIAAEIRIIYDAKYIRATDLDTMAPAEIQPMCPMDEYASSARIWVWFSPPIPPTSLLSMAINVISVGDWLVNITDRMVRGATFWAVARTQHMVHEILFITVGSQ